MCLELKKRKGFADEEGEGKKSAADYSQCTCCIELYLAVSMMSSRIVSSDRVNAFVV
jgi:hypothetical protein